MTKREARREFFLDDDPVGCFEDGYPRRPGIYVYSPYRGPGHAELVAELRSKGQVWCWFVCESARFNFLITKETFVAGSPESVWGIEIAEMNSAPEGLTDS